MVTIWMNEIIWIKYAVIGGLGLLAILQRDGWSFKSLINPIWQISSIYEAWQSSDHSAIIKSLNLLFFGVFQPLQVNYILNKGRFANAILASCRRWMASLNTSTELLKTDSSLRPGWGPSHIVCATSSSDLPYTIGADNAIMILAFTNNLSLWAISLPRDFGKCQTLC